MISTIIFFVCLIIAGGWLFSNREHLFIQVPATRFEGASQTVNLKVLYGPILLAVVGLLVALIQPYKVDRIDAGHVGIKVNLAGSERGVSDYKYTTGWVTYNSWFEKLYEFPTYQQHIEYGDQTVITKGGFSTTITPSFNYALIAEAAGDMFVNLRLSIKEVEQGWLRNAIISSVNDVANRWAVDSIFNHREEFEACILTECNKRVIKWFKVSQLRSNILPPPALAKSIEDKTKAIQDALTEYQKALVADAQAKKKIALAKGDSADQVIRASAKAEATVKEAEGDAKAMKLKQAQLSPLYNDYLRAVNWDGHYPTTMLGGNTSALYNMK